jgi:N-acetylglucosamine transport system permease protein
MSFLKLKTEKTRRNLFIFGVLIPIFIVHAVFNLINSIVSAGLSLFQWNGYMLVGKFVGLANINRMIHDPRVWEAFKNNLYFAFWSLVFTISLALFLAFVVTRVKLWPKENKFYEVVFFFPNTLSMVIISLLWLFVYNPSFGPASSFVKMLGLDPPIWLGDTKWVKPSIILPQVWASAGFYFLIYVAAIKSIPHSLYEAAELDGAGNYRKFFNITLPLIRNIVITTIIYSFVTSFNGAFTIVKIMSNGGPNGASEVLATYLYSIGIEKLNYGYGSAIGLLSMLFSLLVYFLLTKGIKNEAYEY